MNETLIAEKIAKRMIRQSKKLATENGGTAEEKLQTIYDAIKAELAASEHNITL